MLRYLVAGERCPRGPLRASTPPDRPNDTSAASRATRCSSSSPRSSPRRTADPLVQISLKGTAGHVEIRTAAGPAAAFLDDIDVRWDESPTARGPTGHGHSQRHAASRRHRHRSRFRCLARARVGAGLRSRWRSRSTRTTAALGALTLFSRGEDLRGRCRPPRAFADQVALSLLAASGRSEIPARPSRSSRRPTPSSSPTCAARSCG